MAEEEEKKLLFVEFGEWENRTYVNIRITHPNTFTEPSDFDVCMLSTSITFPQHQRRRQAILKYH